MCKKISIQKQIIEIPEGKTFGETPEIPKPPGFPGSLQDRKNKRNRQIGADTAEEREENMNQELYAVCPGCGGRATVTAFRWDWEQEESYAQVECTCGRSEVPYAEGRVLEIGVNNPYFREDRFRLLIPSGWERDDKWHKVGQLLLAGWRW